LKSHAHDAIQQRRTNPRRWPRGWLAALFLAAGASCHHDALQPVTPTSVVRLAIGPQGGGMYPLGQKLAAEYSKSIGQLTFSVEESSGTFANAEAVAAGTAELGFVWADVAYLAYAGQADFAAHPLSDLRGIAVLQLTPIHLVVRPGLLVASLKDLRTRRVGIGPLGSGTSVTADLLFRAFQISAGDVRTETLPFNDAAKRLLDGSLDAMFVGGIPPAESVTLATRGGARLLSLEEQTIDAVRDEFPFLRPTSIPARAYPGIASPTHTIGVDLLLVCRSSLDEALVYTLTQRFFDALPSLASIQSGLKFMNVDQASSTPIPLHPGAAQYYRERELRQ
jgi:uncharacterized protein